MGFLDQIKSLNEDYKEKKEIYQEKHRTFNAQLGEIERKYQEEKRAEMLRHDKALENLLDERARKINEASESVISDAIVKEIRNMTIEMIRNNKVDNYLMCNLLTRKTGLKWLPKEITGRATHPEFLTDMARYGVMLVNEGHKGFREFYLEYSKDESVGIEHKYAILVESGSVATLNDREAEQSAVEDFNWTLVYLKEKGLLPEYIDKAVNLPYCGEHKEAVISALDEYLNGKESNKESSEDSDEMGK